MKTLLYILLFVLATQTSFGQEVLQTRYYKNKVLRKRVPAKRARYVQQVLRNADSSITTEVKNLRTDEIIKSESYIGKEPTGVWLLKAGSIFDKLQHLYVMDYSFKLVYTDNRCTDTIAGLRSFWNDNDTLKYIAPKLNGEEKDLSRVLANNAIYPDYAREKRIQGSVLLNLTIDPTGKAGDIAVVKSVHPLLDKEAMRLLRLLKFSNGPMLNGKAISSCLTMPIGFYLE